MKKLLGIVVMFTVMLLSMTSCSDVESGSEGFYRTYSNGVDTTEVLSDGTSWHAPWNDVITMSIRQQAVDYDNAKLKDVDQVKLTVDYSAGIRAIKGKTPQLYLLHGEDYITGFVEAKVTSAVKDVFGKYSYVDILGSKRDVVEDEIESLIETEFEGNYILLDYVEVMDIQLPDAIQSQITAKEAQEQKNLTSEKKKQEAINIAAAQIQKAIGDSTSLIINATAQAEEIRIKSSTLKSSPEYIELIKWQGYANGKGSPYGDNNVFGAGTSVIKGLK